MRSALSLARRDVTALVITLTLALALALALGGRADERELELSDATRALERLDSLGRDSQRPPKLSESEVFRWALQQRERVFGIYGRPIVSESRRRALTQGARRDTHILEPDALMYRGYIKRRVSWLKRSALTGVRLGGGSDAPPEALQEALQEAEPPRALNDLTQLVITTELEQVIHKVEQHQ